MRNAPASLQLPITHYQLPITHYQLTMISQIRYTFLLLLLTVVSSTSVLAQPKEPVDDPKIAKQYLAEILSQPEFKTTREESRWKYIGDFFRPSDQTTESTTLSFDFISLMAQFVELIFWLLLGIGMIFLIAYGPRWLEKWQNQSPSQSEYMPNPRLLDNVVEKQSLPVNIPQQAWLVWQSGEISAAISLLYRGALSTLITHNGLRIDDSATESECLHLVKKKESIELYTYFSNLTLTWQNLAYAGRQPTDAEAQRLCREWQQYFG
jgi:hypothetical protein